MTHYELCKITAERFLKESDIVLFEYQTVVSSEHPDVLCYNGGYTTLFEIKLDLQDFKKDILKSCRIQNKFHCDFHVYTRDYNKTIKIIWDKPEMQQFVIEHPHLGRRRYYVCPKGLIQPEEISNGWGLYWYNGKFSLKKESRQFRHDMFRENILLSHATRKMGNGHSENILIRKYEKNY
jgi:hypothetical protein